MAFWLQRIHTPHHGKAPPAVTVNGIKNGPVKSQDEHYEAEQRQPEAGKSYADAVKEEPKSEPPTRVEKSKGSSTVSKKRAVGVRRWLSLILGIPSDSGLL